MSTQAEVIPLPSPQPATTSGRATWLGGFPIVPTLILLTIALVAVFADQLAPHNPEIGSLTARFKPPFWQTGGTAKYLLGTDQPGRHVLSRLIFGARVSMVVGITAVPVAGVGGGPPGVGAGHLGGGGAPVIMHPHPPTGALPALALPA